MFWTKEYIMFHDKKSIRNRNLVVFWTKAEIPEWGEKTVSRDWVSQLSFISEHGEE